MIYWWHTQNTPITIILHLTIIILFWFEKINSENLFIKHNQPIIIFIWYLMNIGHILRPDSIIKYFIINIISYFNQLIIILFTYPQFILLINKLNQFLMIDPLIISYINHPHISDIITDIQCLEQLETHSPSNDCQFTVELVSTRYKYWVVVIMCGVIVDFGGWI